MAMPSSQKRALGAFALGAIGGGFFYYLGAAWWFALIVGVGAAAVVFQRMTEQAAYQRLADGDQH